MNNKIITLTALSVLATILLAGGAFAALNFDGQSGVFLNALAYPLAPSTSEVSSHTVDMDSLGTVSTYNFGIGLKKNVELGFTRIASNVTGVRDQNLILAKWQFAAETKKAPAVSVWTIHRSLIGGSSDTDLGLSATKVVTVAKRALILDLGVRSTKALGLGLFGIGNSRETKLEGSAAIFVTSKFIAGTEFKQQIGVRAWHDVAFRYIVNNNLNIDAGIANFNSALDNQAAVALTYKL